MWRLQIEAQNATAMLVKGMACSFTPLIMGICKLMHVTMTDMIFLQVCCAVL